MNIFCKKLNIDIKFRAACIGHDPNIPKMKTIGQAIFGTFYDNIDKAPSDPEREALLRFITEIYRKDFCQTMDSGTFMKLIKKELKVSEMPELKKEIREYTSEELLHIMFGDVAGTQLSMFH